MSHNKDPDDGVGEGTAPTINSVHLGFVETIETEEQLRRVAHRSPNFEDWDGGQVGGCPSFLIPQHVPDTPLCQQCGGTPMNFLCQIYAPVDEYEDRAFHRSLYVFACSKCQNDASLQNTVHVVRCQLPQDNAYFPADPSSPDISSWKQHLTETHGVNLCQVCGLRGKYKCPLQQLYFCSKQHQKEYKKYVFDKVKNGETPSSLPSVFPVAELAVEGEMMEPGLPADAERNTLFETSYDEEDDSDAELEQADLNRMTGKKGTVEHDQFTQTFMQRIKNQPDQALRYARWKEVDEASDAKANDGALWIQKDYQPSSIPDCPYCGASRHFEFQIMPQMLDHVNRNSPVVDHMSAATYQQYKVALQQAEDLIREAPPEAIPPELVEKKERATEQMRQYLLQQRQSTLDFGVIAVYTCTNSCGTMDDINNSTNDVDNSKVVYREEFAWRQPCLDLS